MKFGFLLIVATLVLGVIGCVDTDTRVIAVNSRYRIVAKELSQGEETESAIRIKGSIAVAVDNRQARRHSVVIEKKLVRGDADVAVTVTDDDTGNKFMYEFSHETSSVTIRSSGGTATLVVNPDGSLGVNGADHPTVAEAGAALMQTLAFAPVSDEHLAVADVLLHDPSILMDQRGEFVRDVMDTVEAILDWIMTHCCVACQGYIVYCDQSF